MSKHGKGSSPARTCQIGTAPASSAPREPPQGQAPGVADASGLGRGSGVGFAGSNRCFALAELEQLRAGGWQLCVKEMCWLVSAVVFFFFF